MSPRTRPPLALLTAALLAAPAHARGAAAATAPATAPAEAPPKATAAPPAAVPPQATASAPAAVPPRAPASAPVAPPPPAPPQGPRFTLGAQYFLRTQGRFNGALDPAAGDRDLFLVQRARLSVRAEHGPLTAFVQLQDARQWGFERSSVANMGNTDLHQGTLELAGARGPLAGYARLGRQEVMIGTRRLLANNDWNPNAQAFDGLRLHGQADRFALDLGGFVLGFPGAFTVPDPADPAATLTVRTPGSYLGYVNLVADLHPAAHLDLLALAVRHRPIADEPTRRRDVINLGARVYGEPLAGLTYDLELHGQTGAARGRPHHAYFGVAELRYVAAVRARPGAFARALLASGEACRGTPDPAAPDGGCDGRGGDFYRFYGYRHAVYGVVDLGGLTNVRDLAVGGLLTPHRTLHLELGWNYLQLDKPTGRWIDGFDHLMGAGWDPQNRARALGHEPHLAAEWTPLAPLVIRLGYGAFVPLAAARRLLGPAVQHFAYLWMIATF